MQRDRQDTRDRITSAAGVAGLHALLGYLLIAGLSIDVQPNASKAIKLFDVAAEPPPPPVEIVPKPAPKPRKAAGSPTSLNIAASPLVLPKPSIRFEAPKVIATPVPSVGAGPSEGAPAVPGAGTGTGGEGSGTGGGSGDGTGDGDERTLDEIVTRARRIGGRITERDLPRAVRQEGTAGTVFTRYFVGTDGRVSGCEVTRSSGNPELDEHTCLLIESRFRYRPARDATGRPVADVLFGRHQWWTGE